MTEISRPWNGTTVGDAGPYSDQDWHELYRSIIGWGGNRANSGVFLSSGIQPDDGLRVEEQSPAAQGVTILSGAALIQGIAYINDADENLTIAANGAGNPRIDTVVLQADYALQTVRLVVKQGAAAASPSRPTLTQTPNVMWEIPLADVAVANGFATIVQANITQRQEWVNAPPGVYLDSVLNNSGGELTDGDVVVWDNTADRAVTTTTTMNDPNTAGVWSGGSTPDGSYGRVLVNGIGLIRATTAVTRGDRLSTSTTAGSAIVNAGLSRRYLAQALETTSGAGLALAYIQSQTENETEMQFVQTANRSFNTTNAVETLFGSGVGSLDLLANLLTVGKSVRIKIAGFFSSFSSAGNFTIALTLDGVTIATTGATVMTNSMSNVGFELDFIITCRSVGVGGTVFGQGMFKAGTTSVNSAVVDVVATAAAAVDTTVPLTIDVTWQWGTSNASNAVTVTNAIVEVL